MFKEILQGPKRTLVSDAIDEVLAMVQRAEQMFAASCGTLLDDRQAADLSRDDESINVGERMVRRLIFQHLMVNPQRDLPASLALLSIVHDVERLGDYAKSLAELNQWDELRRPGSRYGEACRELHGMIAPLFALASQAVRDSDADAARSLMQRHTEVKLRTDEMVTSAMADTGANRDTVLYSLAARYLRRVSAHLSNVASSVVNPLDQLAGKLAE